jgi:hypothetical protein
LLCTFVNNNNRRDSIPTFGPNANQSICLHFRHLSFVQRDTEGAHDDTRQNISSASYPCIAMQIKCQTETPPIQHPKQPYFEVSCFLCAGPPPSLGSSVATHATSSNVRRIQLCKARARGPGGGRRRRREGGSVDTSLLRGTYLEGTTQSFERVRFRTGMRKSHLPLRTSCTGPLCPMTRGW